MAAKRETNGYQEEVMTFCLGKAYKLDEGKRESPCWVKPVLPVSAEHMETVRCFPEWVGDSAPDSYHLYFHTWGTAIDFACAVEIGIRQGREGLDADKAAKFVAHVWRVATACNPHLEEEVREAARILNTTSEGG